VVGLEQTIKTIKTEKPNSLFSGSISEIASPSSITSSERGHFRVILSAQIADCRHWQMAKCATHTSSLHSFLSLSLLFTLLSSLFILNLSLKPKGKRGVFVLIVFRVGLGGIRLRVSSALRLGPTGFTWVCA
jgi:hypothetical protein